MICCFNKLAVALLNWTEERERERGDIGLSAVICGRIDSGVRWTEERWYCLWCSALPVLLHHTSLRFPGRAATEAPANIPINRRNSTQIRAVLDLCWQTSAGTGLFIPIFPSPVFLTAFFLQQLPLQNIKCQETQAGLLCALFLLWRGDGNRSRLLIRGLLTLSPIQGWRESLWGKEIYVMSD